MNKILTFIKYHNAFAIGVSLVLVLTFSAIASEDVRNAVIGEEIITEQGIDNSQILAADLDNFDMALQITNVTEDNEKYYIDYTYKTIAIIDNNWQEVWREKRLAVSKKSLADGDLTLYVTEELSQVVGNELVYLKEVQEIEREKGLQKIVASVKYTGLLGLLSNLKAMVSPELACQPTDEVCDAVDNDCDGLIDEDLGQTTCGLGACQVTVDNCLNGALIACVPGTPILEICGDGVDNNCDGIVDTPKICRPPAPLVEEEPVCQPNWSCSAWSPDVASIVLGQEFTQTRVCQDMNNCGISDGRPTEQQVAIGTLTTIFYLDADSDGYGNANQSVNTTSAPEDGLHYVLNNTDCNDENSAINPGATEICDDSIDNDCDSKIDAEDEDCQTAPATPPAPVCDAEHLDLCTTQELCEGTSLYWYNETCNLEPEASACTPDWSCTDWQPLPETIACGQAFIQTRTCTDSNNCGTDEGKPIEEQPAVGTDASTCVASNATGICQDGACVFTCAEGYQKDDAGVCQLIESPAGQ